MAVVRTCTICGLPPIGRYFISMQGEVTCARHPAVARCDLCGRRTDVVDATWAHLGGGRVRCPTCGAHAIDTAAVANHHLKRIRSGIAEMGYALRTPVTVRLVDAEELAGMLVEGPGAMGATRLTVDVGGAHRALEVCVLQGLTPVLFGSTIVHENMHAWLAENGVRAREPRVEEGLCELVAHQWLSRGRTRPAAHRRQMIETRADPIYGEGYRVVRTAVDAWGLPAVLDSIRRRGTLPA